MGEASRRLRERKAFMARQVRCRYSLGRVAYAMVPEFRDGVLVDDGAVGAILDLVRTPNAMRPVGFALGGDEVRERMTASMTAALSDNGLNHLFDDRGTFMGTMPAPEFEAAYGISSYAPIAYYALHGEPFRIGGSPLSGLCDDAGPIPDPVASLRGAVRIDSEGRFLIAADASLSVQYAALSDLLASGVLDGEAATSVNDHLLHVAMLRSHLELNRSPDPGAWMDILRARDLAVEARDALDEPGSVNDIAFDLAVDLDVARQDDPMWPLTALIDIHPESWTSRDTPGSGREWVFVDRDLKAVLGEGNPLLPGADVQYVIAGNDMRTRMPFRELLSQGEAVGSRRSATVVRHQGLGLMLGLLDRGDQASILVWREGADVPARSDPLMAETFVGLVEEPPAYVRPSHASHHEGMRSLASLSLLPVLPSVEHEEDYAILMLLASHRRGKGISDLCASLAVMLREGRADGAFRAQVDDEPDDELYDPFNVGPLTEGESSERGRATSQAEAFGGTPDEPLMAMLRFMEEDQWADMEVLRDLALLRDAVHAGMTLEDMSLACLEVQGNVGDDD
jgi:hypothetical protein